MKNKKIQTSIYTRIFIIAVSVSVTAFVCFLIAQHSIRTASNDPQTMIVQDIVKRIEEGDSPQKDWLGRGKRVELSLDRRSFFIIYDSNKKIIATSTMLNGQPPELPQGVLDTAKEKGQYEVTWEPAAGIREALVVKPYQTATQSGYVVAGRSLSAAEEATKTMAIYIIIVWLVIVTGAGMLVFFLAPHKKAGH